MRRQPQQPLTITKPNEGLIMTTENINTKRVSIPDDQATYTAIFNASNQIEVARGYISSVDDTELMGVCAKRGIDLILENAIDSLARHVEILMDKETATNNSLTQKNKPVVQNTVMPSQIEVPLPAMYEYLEDLRGISANSNGKVSCCKKSLQQTIELGTKVSFNLKAGLKGIGDIISCLDQGQLAISLGWLISNVGDFLQALENTQTNLINSIDGQLWPNIVFERSEFSFTSLLTQLPYVSHHSVLDPNKASIENLLGWCQWQEGCQTTNIRALHAAIGSAKNSENLDMETLYLGSLMMGEWSALVEFINDSEDMAVLLLKNRHNRETGSSS